MYTNTLKPFYLSRDKSISILLVQLKHNRAISLADITNRALSSVIKRFPETLAILSIAYLYLSGSSKFQLIKLVFYLCKCF